MIDWDALNAANAALNAFVDFDRGAEGGQGPLAGATIGIKSNIAVKGLPWTAGMGLRRGVIASEDAPVVCRLRAAGAVILGTLNMHEAALGATTDNPFYGRTMNPHRAGYTPGGSSGGSGAAVAAGLCDAALGTDTLGSVRIPAAYNGVYGLKPTHGAVSGEGLVPLARALDCIGPLARSLDMLRRLWVVIRESEADDESATQPFARLLTLRDLAGVEVQPDIAAAHERALRAAALPIEILALPDTTTAIRLAAVVEVASELAVHIAEAYPPDSAGISLDLAFILERMSCQPHAPEVLERTRRTLVEALGVDGVLLLPTTPQAAFPHGRAPVNQADFTGLANIAGLPALAIPAGRDESGLPVGVQLIGPAGSEARLMDLAAALGEHLGGFVPPHRLEEEKAPCASSSCST